MAHFIVVIWKIHMFWLDEFHNIPGIPSHLLCYIVYYYRLVFCLLLLTGSFYIELFLPSNLLVMWYWETTSILQNLVLSWSSWPRYLRQWCHSTVHAVWIRVRISPRISLLRTEGSMWRLVWSCVKEIGWSCLEKGIRFRGWRSREESVSKENMEKAGWGRKCEGWFEKEDALCWSRWSVGVDQFAAGLRVNVATLTCWGYYHIAAGLRVNVATLTCWGYYHILQIGVCLSYVCLLCTYNYWLLCVEILYIWSVNEAILRCFIYIEYLPIFHMNILIYSNEHSDFSVYYKNAIQRKRQAILKVHNHALHPEFHKHVIARSGRMRIPAAPLIDI